MAYSQLLETRRAALTQSEQRIRLHGRVQLATLLIALTLLVPALDHTFSIVWEVLPATAFLALFVSRDRLLQTSERRRHAVRYFESALARRTGTWPGQGESGERYLDPLHPYARDLDLFGKGSLFELLCQARTPMGQDALAAWLLKPAAPDVIREHQRAVAELAVRLDLREDLAVVGENARAGVDTEALFAWAEREPLLRPSPFQIVARGLSVLGATAVVALLVYLVAAFGAIQLPEKTMAALEAYFLLMSVAYGSVMVRFKKRTGRIIREIEKAGYDLSLIAGVLRRLELERFQAPRLAALRAELDTEGWPPSRRIARLNRLIELIDSRRNGVLRVIAPLLLWDLHLSYAIEAWRSVSGPAMRRWRRRALRSEPNGWCCRRSQSPPRSTPSIPCRPASPGSTPKSYGSARSSI